LYGDHAYGRYFPTPEQLQGYTLEQVKAFHAANYGAARATLYVVGVFDRAAVERAAREAFGDWAAGAPPAKNPPMPNAKRSVSLTEIFKEIDRLRDEAPPEPELAGIKNNLAGVFVLQNGSRAGVASQLQFVNLHGLGEDYLTGYVRRVLAVTPDDVRETARKYL